MKKLFLKHCGRILLISAVFFSALSNIYLKAMQREKIGLLQTMKKQGTQMREKQNRLQIEYDILFSPIIFKKKAASVGLIDPVIRHKIDQL